MSLSFFRQRFGLIMVGVVLVVCVILMVHQRFFKTSSERPLPSVDPVADVPLTPIDPVELQIEWRTAVAQILEEYDKSGDARAAKERLLTVRVPASGRDTHLALFIAFNALSESRPEGRAKLIEARTVFTALPSVSSSTTSTISTTP